MDNVMIIVPHEDDEALMTGGIIERLVHEGSKVKVVIATNGDYQCKTQEYGQLRIRESLEALNYLGLNTEHVIFLGYADTGMEEEVSFLNKLYNSKSEEEIYPSSCGYETYGLPGIAEDYHYTITGKHAVYNRANFMKDLSGVIREHMPDYIFVTSFYDAHGDHSALCKFTIDAIKSIQDYKPTVYQGIVHSPAGDHKWPSIEKEEDKIVGFSMPEGLEQNTPLKWEERKSFEVPIDMKVIPRKNNRKYQALLKYNSCLKPLDRDYLLSFVKSDEIFWKVDIENL